MDELAKITIAKITNVKLLDLRNNSIHEEDQYYIIEEDENPKAKMEYENKILGYNSCGYFDIDIKEIYLDLKLIYENA